MKKRKVEEEFLELVNDSRDILFKICNAYGDSREEREDLSQEIIFQLWKSFPTFQRKSKFSTWMYRVALNTALLSLRKKKKRPQEEELTDNFKFQHQVNHIDSSNEEIIRLYQAIKRLKEIDRSIILLHLEGMSYKEVAEIVGITEKNVSVRLVRIKNRLRELVT